MAVVTYRQVVLGPRLRAADGTAHPAAAAAAQTPVPVRLIEVRGPPGPPGPPGPDGAASTTYTHTQSPASDTWTVNHNLGYRADVYLTTLGGVEFEAEIVHTSNDQCIVSLASPMTGQARCT